MSVSSRTGMLGRSLVIAGAAVVAFVLLPVTRATAHAEFVSATPGPGTTWSTPPTSVRIEFSEPLEPVLSGIEVDRSSGRVVPTRSAGVDPADPRAYAVALPRLRPDRYVVVWHTVSATDGHSRRGAYSFTLDLPNGSAPRTGASEAIGPGGPSPPPTWEQAIVRWIGLVGLFLLAGSLLVATLGSGEGVLALTGTWPRLRLLSLCGCGGLLAGTAGDVISAWMAVGRGGPGLGDILSTPAGRWWETRLISVVVVMCTLRWGLPRSAANRLPAARGCVLAAAVGLTVLSYAETSHGAAASRAGVGLAYESVHILAASAWLGGAAAVAMIWSVARAKRRSLLRRYSITAGIAVPAVLLSGLGNAALELGSIGDLVGSSYGTALLVKLSVVIVLIAIAAANAILLKPAFDSGQPQGRRLDHTIAVEAVIGLIVLAPTAVLAVLSPSRPGDSAGPATWLGIIALTGVAGTLIAAARAVSVRRLRSITVAAGAAGLSVAVVWAGIVAIGAGPPDGPRTSWEEARAAPPVALANARVWQVPTPAAGLMMPAIAPDGSVWIAEMDVNKLARLDPGGNVVQEFRFPGANREPMGVAVAPDGRVWLAQEHAMALGMFEPARGHYREFPIPGGVSAPVGIAVSSDGDVWFTEASGNRIGKFDPRTARFTQYPVPTADAMPYWLALDATGTVWFTEFGAGKIGSLDPRTGQVHEYAVPGAPNVAGIAVADGGTVWFVSCQGALFAITPPSDRLRRIGLPVAGDYGVAVSPDGQVWVGRDGGRTIFAVDPDTGSSREYRLPAGSAPWWPVVDHQGHVWVALAGERGNGLAELRHSV